MDSSTPSYRTEIDQIGKDEWSELLQHFDDATIYQTWFYGAVRWGNDNLSHLVLRKDNKVIALAQVTIKKLQLFKAGIAYIPWGPIWHRHGEEIDYETLRQLLKGLKQKYVLDRGLLLRITPNQIEGNDDRITKVYMDEGFKRDSSIVSYRTLILDLEPSLENIRKNFARKWRNRLNNAERNNLNIIEGNSDELFKIFLMIQKEVVDRKGFTPGVNYNEFREIQKLLPEPLKMKIVVCENNSKPVAAAIYSDIGDTGINLLAATANEGLKYNGSNLLQWRIIQCLKEKGCRWYDLGGTNPLKNPLVYRFKSGIVGKSGKEKMHIGQFELCQNTD